MNLPTEPTVQPRSSTASELLDSAQTKPWEGGPTFSLSNRLYRALFCVCWALLASWTPRPLSRWRRFVLVLFGAQIHPTAKVYGNVSIWSPRNLKMGASSAIGPGATIYSMAPITLGAYCIVSQGAHLCAGSHDIEDPHFQLTMRPITIGERAWVAAEAFVGPGVTVGEGAVLGARGCAMKDLEPWTIYRGNPAVRVRERRIRF
jgi:putative colanic acid biosynthesis acetyltransferase WcaF